MGLITASSEKRDTSMFIVLLEGVKFEQQLTQWHIGIVELIIVLPQKTSEWRLIVLQMCEV